jgi:lipid-A-disaccharide synthase
VVCYKANWISYQIAKRIITLEYISLVNLIMKKEVVTELIQNNFTQKKLKTAMEAILLGPARTEQILNYDALIKKLGGTGASAKAAVHIYQNSIK